MVFCRVALFLSGMAHCISAASPKAVDELKMEAFLGHWYQTYASAFVIYGTEFGANCVTADYGVLEGHGGVVTVKNTVYPLGHRTSVTGYAVPKPGVVGELEVHLGPGSDPAHAQPFKKTNFLVMELGPVIDEKYDYALVTDPTGLSLYVLVRDVPRFRGQYEAAVLQSLEAKGFTTTVNKPRKTNQDNCHNGRTTDAQNVIV